MPRHDRLAREAAAIADRLPLVEPTSTTCRCGAPLEDGRHLVARADREIRRARLGVRRDR